ncbi:AMP-activated serine/threonine-protein kinase regulatory subunit [Balamuthia mandrillaris]
MACTPETVRNFLSQVKVGDLVAADPKPLIDADSDATLENVLELLTQNNILSVPIYEKTPHGKKKYVGIISSFDIMTYVAFATYFKDQELSLEEQDFSAIRFNDLKASALLGATSRESEDLWYCTESTDLFTVLEYFHKGVHRCLVESEEGEGDKCYLLTQSDVIRFLSKNESKLGEVVHKRVEELNLVNPLGGGKGVASLPSYATALEGFRVMKMHEVQALPVVEAEKDNSIITTLSTSDLKGIHNDSLKDVLLPVLDYLKGREKDGKLVHPLTCHSRDNLAEIMLKMLSARRHKHQVWVVNSAMVPIGVISMTDIIRSTYTFCLGL